MYVGKEPWPCWVADLSEDACEAHDLDLVRVDDVLQHVARAHGRQLVHVTHQHHLQGDRGSKK